MTIQRADVALGLFLRLMIGHIRETRTEIALLGKLLHGRKKKFILQTLIFRTFDSRVLSHFAELLNKR